MKANKLKQLKPSYDSLRIIGRVTFEATGDSFWLSIVENTSASLDTMKFFEAYYVALNWAIETLANKDKFEHNLIKLNGEKVPFLYNNLT